MLIIDGFQIQKGFHIMMPNIKLALVFAKIAREHGPKILHGNNPDLLTRDLGEALKRQKQALADPSSGMIMTAYEALPLIVEVKMLTFAVAKQLDIETKGKPDITVLEEILAKSEERNGGKYAKGIKETLDWTRALFSHPEIQDVLNMEMTAIEKPTSIKDFVRFASQLVGRSQDELTRVSEFLRKAKEIDDMPKQEPKKGDNQPQPPTP